jgi:hypothetical protein
MTKEMTRKQFLGLVGVVLASVFGMDKIISLVFGKQHSVSKQLGNIEKMPSSYGHVK